MRRIEAAVFSPLASFNNPLSFSICVEELDVTEYAELLVQTLPSVIHSEKEHEHFISILEELEHRSQDWTPAEAKLAELLTLLIEQFEDESYQLKAANPIEVLRELMESNDLKQKDLVDVFGTESTVSAVLKGKRDMTREHIKRLSERFHVSPEVFF
jgi:HTH-type transcriptional regulator / antitoxin HigA